MALDKLLLFYSNANEDNCLPDNYAEIFNELKTFYLEEFYCPEVCGDKDCLVFGSYLYSYGGKIRDIDVSLCGVSRTGCPLHLESKSSRMRILQNFMQQLCMKPSFLRYKYEVIPSRIPLLKISDGENIKIDISVGGKVNAYKSHLIRILMKKFRSFRILCPLVKSIFQSRWLNDSRGGTFNSYSIILLCMSMLQLMGYIPPLANLIYPSIPNWIRDPQSHFAPPDAKFVLDDLNLELLTLTDQILPDFEHRCNVYLNMSAQALGAWSTGFLLGLPRQLPGSFGSVNENCSPRQLLHGFFVSLKFVLDEITNFAKGGESIDGKYFISPLAGDVLRFCRPKPYHKPCLFVEDPFTSCTNDRGQRMRDNTCRTFGSTETYKEVGVRFLRDSVSSVLWLLKGLENGSLRDAPFAVENGGGGGGGERWDSAKNEENNEEKEKDEDEETEKNNKKKITLTETSMGLWELHASVFTILFGAVECAKSYDNLVRKVLHDLRRNHLEILEAAFPHAFEEEEEEEEEEGEEEGGKKSSTQKKTQKKVSLRSATSKPKIDHFWIRYSVSEVAAQLRPSPTTATVNDMLGVLTRFHTIAKDALQNNRYWSHDAWTMLYDNLWIQYRSSLLAVWKHLPIELRNKFMNDEEDPRTYQRRVDQSETFEWSCCPEQYTFDDRTELSQSVILNNTPSHALVLPVISQQF